MQAIATLIKDVSLLTKSGLGSLGEVYKLQKIRPHPKVDGISDP